MAAEASPHDGGVAQLYNNTGQWLGLIGTNNFVLLNNIYLFVGGDYYGYGSGNFTAYHDFNAQAISYWDSNGLVTMSFSMPNPTTAGTYSIS